MPTQQLPTWCVAIEPARETVDRFARRLRVAKRAVFGRIQHDRLLLDLRTVFPRQDMHIAEAIGGLAEEPTPEESESAEEPAEQDGKDE